MKQNSASLTRQIVPVALASLLCGCGTQVPPQAENQPIATIKAESLLLRQEDLPRERPWLNLEQYSKATSPLPGVYSSVWQRPNFSVLERFHVANDPAGAEDQLRVDDFRAEAIEDGASAKNVGNWHADGSAKGKPEQSRLLCSSLAEGVYSGERACMGWVWQARYGNYVVVLEVGGPEGPVAKGEFLKLVAAASQRFSTALGRI